MQEAKAETPRLFRCRQRAGPIRDQFISIAELGLLPKANLADGERPKGQRNAGRSLMHRPLGDLAPLSFPGHCQAEDEQSTLPGASLSNSFLMLFLACIFLSRLFFLQSFFIRTIRSASIPPYVECHL